MHRALSLCLLLAALKVVPAQDREPPKSLPLVPAVDPIDTQTQVNWAGLFKNSGLFLGIQHAYRLGSERGTRNGLKGPFFSNYAEALGNLHGWADGDEFYVNYVGHPMQGAVSALIFVQNDIPRYRNSEFGRNRDYWRGRLRASAFSAAYSIQFEIGPASEASIGAVQRKYPAYGFVDHVITTTVGMGWMIAEDALDRYVIRKFESRFRNPAARLLVRSWLNPSRSFANMINLDAPWHRYTRPNLFGANVSKGDAERALPKKKLHGRTLDPVFSLRANDVVAPFEFHLTFQPTFYTAQGGPPCLGAGATVAFRMASRLQALVDVGGCNLRGLPKDWSGDSLHYMAGLRWTPWASGKWSSHAEFLLGGEKMTQELLLPTVRQLLYTQWQANGSLPAQEPRHDRYTIGSEANAVALQGGIGLDYRINSALQLRVANIDYRHSSLPILDGRNYRDSLNFSTGFVLRMGTW